MGTAARAIAVATKTIGRERAVLEARGVNHACPRLVGDTDHACPRLADVANHACPKLADVANHACPKLADVASHACPKLADVANHACPKLADVANHACPQLVSDTNHACPQFDSRENFAVSCLSYFDLGCATGSPPCAHTLLDGFAAFIAEHPDAAVGAAWSHAVARYVEAEHLRELKPTADWYPPSIYFQPMKFVLLGDPTVRMK